MSRSPLSGAFAGSSEPAKKNKKNGALLLISGIALATSIGGVFAANTSITLNGGTSPIEFGQGVATVDSCAENATVSMTQVYTMEEFYVDEVTVDFDPGCVGKTATVTLIGKTGFDIASQTGSFSGTVGATSFSQNLSARQIVAAHVGNITVTTSDTATP